MPRNYLNLNNKKIMQEEMKILLEYKHYNI